MQSIPGGVKWIFYTGHCNEMMPANPSLTTECFSVLSVPTTGQTGLRLSNVKVFQFFFLGCFLGVLSRVTVIVTGRFLQILLS